MGTKLTDLLPVEKWMAFEKEIFQRTGMSGNVFNTDGIRISEYHEWPNRLCPAVKATDKGQAFICAVAHMNLASQAMKTKAPVAEECDAGLLKLVVPIFAGDEFVGAVGACGLLLEDGEVDSFAVHKMTDIDEDEVERLSEGIASIDSEQITGLSLFIQERIGEIVGE